LRFWTPETAPRDYARTQHNLGTAYCELLTGDRAANLERAIACYQEALRFRTPETAPLDYASTQNSLGNAYSDLLTGDRLTHLKQAIACYQQALRFRTPDTAPLDYARTQNSLGATYTSLPKRDRAANLKEAITCYREALRFWTPETVPLDYAHTQHNLGMAYSSLPTGDRAAHLSQAITYYEEALRFLTPAVTPLDYALIQNSLGNAYSDLLTGDRAANLERAIACYQEALRFRTPETAPLDYASTQNNLGLAYNNLLAGNRVANVMHAIARFQEALRFWTPETAPAECRMVNRNLAHLQFAQGAWQTALDAYHAAIDVGEQLYQAGLFAESKTTEVAENAALYRHAAFSAVRCGQTTEALLILERGKTRLLAEAMRWRIPRPANIPDEVWATFEQAGAAVRAIQSWETPEFRQGGDPIQFYRAREQAIRTVQAALDAAIEQVRLYAPDFLCPIDFSAIQALLSDESTALVAFCITDRGSMSFVVSHNSDQEVQVVEIPTFTQVELHRLLAEFNTDGRPIGGWLDAYDHYRNEPTPASFAAWQETIAHTLTEVGQHLLAPLLSTLPLGIERITFLPSAELFPLPLHAAFLSENNPDYLCDRYEVNYAPSVEVLTSIRGKAVQAATPELYAVINPEDDPRLVLTLTEGTAIAKFFPKCSIDKGRSGTKQQALAGVQGRTYVHFACHGSYDWDNPSASGLQFSNSRLTLAELQNGVVDLTAVRLVTLSACETGISDIIKGSAEEFVGIPAGFLLAGASCVVSSLWAVPDFSTALLMERFYHNHLRSGMDFAAALREAQVWVRELTTGEVTQYAEHWYQHSHRREKTELFRLIRYYRHQAEQDPSLRPFAHPYYWAAFTVNGM
jgi:CHAT domain-containing protein